MTYKRLTDVLGGHWEKPWADLSVEQQWAWFATTFFAHQSSTPVNMSEAEPVPDNGSWDMNTVKVRKRIAEEYDAQHDPVQKLIAWHDMSMHAAVWLKRANVKPGEAAMLLCRIDPLERDWRGDAPDPERIYVDDDKASPDRYRVLLRVFLDEAETDAKPRTLLDWRDVAKRGGLRYHEWIDEYLDAQKVCAAEMAETSKQGAGATVELTPADNRANLDMSRERGCRARILEKWVDIEKLHGDKPSRRQVLQVINRDSDQKFEITNVGNTLSKLRAAELIP